MGKFADVVSRIKSTEKMHELTEELDKIFDYMEEYYSDLYDKAIKKVESVAYDIDLDEAEKIVSQMKPYGEKWTYEAVKKYVMSKGIEDKYVIWYLVMNMTYNDYRNTASLVDMSEDEEFYFSLSKDFIDDIDGKPFKAERYFGEYC